MTKAELNKRGASARPARQRLKDEKIGLRRRSILSSKSAMPSSKIRMSCTITFTAALLASITARSRIAGMD